LKAWNQFESLRASVSIGRALWDRKNSPFYSITVGSICNSVSNT